ncbi:MAG: MmcQ/YjbR family DNA-binding protein [Nocardioides sp.]
MAGAARRAGPALSMPGCGLRDVVELVDQLPEVTRTDHERYWRLAVAGRTFGYLWEPTRTVGLKQTIAEQLALVAERPETFEVQFTTGGFGWVVVHLEGVERDELAELTFEAWRLTAPTALLDLRGDRLPT